MKKTPNLESFKIVVKKEEYKFIGNKTKCILISEFKAKDCDETLIVTTVTTCCKEDKYSKKVGKKIAYIKAMQKTYDKAFKITNNKVADLCGWIAAYTKFIDKYHRVSNNNLQYLSRYVDR